MDKSRLNIELSQADLLLLTSFENVKGWYPVKLFEYYATGKPILLTPSDHDVMEDFILNANCGKVINELDSCVNFLHSLIMCKEKGEKVSFKHNLSYTEQFSRQNQTKILASLLNRD